MKGNSLSAHSLTSPSWIHSYDGKLRGRIRDAFRRRRLAISQILVGAGRAVAPPRSTLARSAQRSVVLSLEEELGDLTNDAAKHGITEQAAKDLLLMLEIVRWLRGEGEAPSRGAIELVEVHAAVYNDAFQKDERDQQWAFAQVLGVLLDGEAAAFAAGHWRRRRINIETAEARSCRDFGEVLDERRRSRDLTIGALASQAQLDVATVIALTFGARKATASETRLLAGALGVDAEELSPHNAVNAAEDDFEVD